MDTYLVMYDVAHPRRLRRVARVCESFGLRRQYSVFVCRLSTADIVRLRGRLLDELHTDQDQALIVPLCSRCWPRIEALGRPLVPIEACDLVLIH